MNNKRLNKCALEYLILKNVYWNTNINNINDLKSYH